MSLRFKFAVLLGCIGLIMAATLGMAYGFGAFLERELLTPFRSFTTTLRPLAELKRLNGLQTGLLPGPGRDEPGREFVDGQPEPEPVIPDESTRLAALEEYEFADNRIQSITSELRSQETLEAVLGASTSRNLLARVDSARGASIRYFRSGDPETGVEAGNQHFEIHELIERAEGRILADAQAALLYNQEMRTLYRIVVISGWVCAGLLSVLSIILVRRWITGPVGELRHAAAEIGAGRFEHRVPVRSRDELGQLSAEVNEMSRLIDELQRTAIERERLAAVGEMVRRIVHNIRNPLAGIRGLAELSAREGSESPHIVEQQKEIIATVDRFNQWLRDLLDATAPLRIAPEEVPLDNWLRGVVDAHRPLADSRGIAIEISAIDGARRERFDPRHMDHALAAILANAIQHSPEGGSVGVDVGASENGIWSISIRDEGPGVPADLRRRIFEPYFTTKPDGDGIGLAVAREVIRRHAGELSVGGSEGSGAVFEIRLPRKGIPGDG